MCSKEILVKAISGFIEDDLEVGKHPEHLAEILSNLDEDLMFALNDAEDPILSAIAETGSLDLEELNESEQIQFRAANKRKSRTAYSEHVSRSKPKHAANQTSQRSNEMDDTTTVEGATVNKEETTAATTAVKNNASAGAETPTNQVATVVVKKGVWASFKAGVVNHRGAIGFVLGAIGLATVQAVLAMRNHESAAVTPMAADPAGDAGMGM